MTIDDWIWIAVAAAIAGVIGILWFGAKADEILDDANAAPFRMFEDRKDQTP